MFRYPFALLAASLCQATATADRTHSCSGHLDTEQQGSSLLQVTHTIAPLADELPVDTNSWTSFSSFSFDETTTVLMNNAHQSAFGQPPKLSLAKVGGVECGNLIITIFGIMRTFEYTWPQVAKALQLSEIEACGGRVSVLVSTEAEVRCTQKDCNIPKDFKSNRNAAETWKALSASDFLRKIKDTYGSRLQAVLLSKKKGMERIVPAIEHESHVDVSMLQRATTFAASLGLENAIMIALRADVVFKVPTFPVFAACRTHPGFNIISGVLGSGCCWNWHDYDFGFLSCETDGWDMYFGTFYNTSHDSLHCRDQWSGCSGSSNSPPPFPPGLTGSWPGPGRACCGPSTTYRVCDDRICDVALTFMRKGTRLGNVDQLTHLEFVRWWDPRYQAWLDAA